MTPSQFIAQLKNTGPAGVYLFIGPEMYRRRICRKTLIERMLDETEREDGLTRFEMDQISLAAVIDDASSLSLFARKRVIIVSSAEAALPRVLTAAAEAKDPGVSALTAYSANPTPDTVLVFDVHRFGFDGEDKARIDRVRKYYSSISNVVEFAPYSPDEARKLAADLATRAQMKIALADLDLLVESLGADAARIATEIEKLALFAQGRTVTQEDIRNMTPDARATTIFALVGALGRGDRPKSLDLMETLIREGEYLPLALSFLGTQFRYALAAKEEGLKTSQQVQQHFTRLGVAMWSSRAQQVMETVNAFSRTQLEAGLRKIFETDRALRDRPPDDRLVMERLVLTLTA